MNQKRVHAEMNVNIKTGKVLITKRAKYFGLKFGTLVKNTKKIMSG